MEIENKEEMLRLMDEGKQHLNNAEWEEAEKSYRAALVINSETMDIYTGILLAQLHVTKPEELETVNEDYSASWAYVKIFRYATQKDKDYFQAIEDANTYYRASLMFDSGDAKKIYDAEDMFIRLKKFRDSPERALECSEKIKSLTGRKPITKKKKRIALGVLVSVVLSALLAFLIVQSAADKKDAYSVIYNFVGKSFSGGWTEGETDYNCTLTFNGDGTVDWIEITSGNNIQESYRTGTYQSFAVNKTLFGNYYLIIFTDQYKIEINGDNEPVMITGFADGKTKLSYFDKEE